MKTFALIEIDADGKCCEGVCDLWINQYPEGCLKGWDDEGERGPECLAAEAAARGKLDDPVVLKLARQTRERGWWSSLSIGEVVNIAEQLAEALLRLAGEAE